MKKKLLFWILFAGMYTATEAQWILQSTGFPVTSRGIRDICAVDTNVVWALGYDGSTASAPQIQEFTRTTNGGAKWKASSIPGYTGSGLAMISAVDSMNAWIPVWYANGGGTIIRTSDGGATWTPQPTAIFTAPNGFPNVVHFWNINEGFCMGDPNGGYFEIYTTVDGGTTWVRVPQANIPPHLSAEYGTTGLYSVVGDIVWFTTGKGRVYKSVDKGHHWTVSATGNTSQQMQISFRDANHGIVKVNVSPYDTYFTIDGGATWQPLVFSGTFYANDFCYVPGTTSTYISVGADYVNSFQGTSYSTDEGLNWNVIPLSDTTQFLAVDFVDVNHGWAGAFNTDSVTGGMWKYNGNIFVFDSCAGLAALFTPSADTLDLGTSGLCVFNDLSTGNPSAWNWDFGDGSTSFSQSPSHTYTTTGTFTVGLTVTKGSACTSSYAGTVVVINTSGIVKIDDAPAVQIWPNPAKDVLHVSAGTAIKNIEIYNSLGQIVQTEPSGEMRLEINTGNMVSGIYFIRISTEKGQTGKKIIIGNQ
ncbi:MAG TPA: PKD domain-containing protein [Bacteroidales bacterium]|nr:PKD domain-containing protein [Bacteroidales bacterium]